MKNEIAFDIEEHDYSVHLLKYEDVKAIQALYEKCVDYMLLVDGHPAGKNAAEEWFQNLSPGRSADDKFMFGIVDRLNELKGVLEVMRWYPDEATWWIGLLLFVPEIRSQGVGEKVLQGFTEYVNLNGGKAIMLGVVEDNERAYRFWSKMGFEFIRETEPRSFGSKTHTVRILRKKLCD
jgi:ribosomal protein S18 acetylase RimI-like enzyme